MKRLATLGNNDDRVGDAAEVSFTVFSDSDAQSPSLQSFLLPGHVRVSLSVRTFTPHPKRPPHPLRRAGLHLPRLQLPAERVRERARESEREWPRLTLLPPTPPPARSQTHCSGHPSTSSSLLPRTALWRLAARLTKRRRKGDWAGEERCGKGGGGVE